MNLILLYIERMAAYMIVILPFFLFGRYIYVKRTGRRTTFSHEVLLTLFVIYMTGLISQTVIPHWGMGYLTDTGKFYFDVYLKNDISSVNLIPFHTVSMYLFEVDRLVGDWSSVSLLNLLGNVFLFTPFGLLIPLIWKRLDSILKVFFLGFTLTCSIEFIQYFIGRSSDIDDVILNTAGVLIGYALFWIGKKARQSRN